MEIQYRAIQTEIKNEEKKICGYAAKYKRDSKPLKFLGVEIRETINPGAFNNVLLKNDDVKCLFNHDRNKVLGRIKNNTLQLRADETGLYFECEYDPEITWQSDLVKSIKRGDISQCSFAFTVAEGDTVENYDKENNVYTRQINNFDHLYDVSVVTEPAYEDTEAYVRSIKELKAQAEEDIKRQNKLDIDILKLKSI